MKSKWKKWIIFSKKIVGIEATVLLFIFYIVIIIPLGTILQLFFKDALQSRQSSPMVNTFWRKREKIIQNISFAREQ